MKVTRARSPLDEGPQAAPGAVEEAGEALGREPGLVEGRPRRSLTGSKALPEVGDSAPDGRWAFTSF